MNDNIIKYKEELLQRMESDDSKLIEDLKPNINNLLQIHLPNKMTIQEAEIIGMVIFQIVSDPYSFLANKPL